MMNKADLRKMYVAKRGQLSKEEVAAESKKICDLLFHSFSFASISSVHIFLPILPKNEIDSYYIIDRFRKDLPHIQLVVPKMKGQDIESFILEPETKIVLNSFKVPEPEEAKLFDHSQIDMVLLPLLVFDKAGNRIGYGKGFYDRFLTTCKEDVIKVGLSIFEAEEKIENDPFDVPLDFCVTPEQLYVFS